MSSEMQAEIRRCGAACFIKASHGLQTATAPRYNPDCSWWWAMWPTSGSPRPSSGAWFDTPMRDTRGPLTAVPYLRLDHRMILRLYAFKLHAGRRRPPGASAGIPTSLQHNGPNYLGWLYNALPEHQMALIASGCVPFKKSSGGR